MGSEYSFWSEDGFLKAVACYGPFSFKEFLPFLTERLGDVDSHIDGLTTKDHCLARSRLNVYLEKPMDLEQDEARVSFVTDFPARTGLDFLRILDTQWLQKHHRSYNPHFEVEIFNRKFKKVLVSFSYGFGYEDTVSIHAGDDLSPLLSLMLQILYESMLYASVSDQYKSGAVFGRKVNLRANQRHYEFLRPLMENGFKNAIQWINAHITSDQEAKRKRAYLDYLVRVQAPIQAWERSSHYEHCFHL